MQADDLSADNWTPGKSFTTNKYQPICVGSISI